MNIEGYYIGAYWGARPETPAACTERLLQLVAELASCHELMTSWNALANSLRAALRRKIAMTRETVEPLFKAVEPDDPAELGYRFHCWNGRKQYEEQIGLSTRCGGAPTVSGLPSNVILDLPRPANVVASLYEPDCLFRALRAIVDAWEPDWAVLMSDEYRAQHVFTHSSEWPSGKPYIGWMTYLRQKRLGGLAATDPPPCEAIPIPDRGTIFVLTRDHRFSVENPDDIARAQELTAYLEARGALEPIPSDQPF